MHDSPHDKRHDEAWLRLLDEAEAAADDAQGFEDEEAAEFADVPPGYVPVAAPEWLGAWLWVRRQRAMGHLPN